MYRYFLFNAILLISFQCIKNYLLNIKGATQTAIVQAKSVEHQIVLNKLTKLCSLDIFK